MDIIGCVIGFAWCVRYFTWAVLRFIRGLGEFLVYLVRILIRSASIAGVDIVDQFNVLALALYVLYRFV